MYTLYLDTHYNKIIIIIYKDEEKIVHKEMECNYNHSMNTMPKLIESLKEAKIAISDINEIIVCNGPGSFTGIRIGVTIAKTLAFTLNVPIKMISSLLLKAISFKHEEVIIIEREKNGVFIAKFNEENDLIEDYKYLKNSEYKQLEDQINGIDQKEIDYLKLIQYAKKIEPTNPHLVNPLYVKKIEVQK